MDISNRDSYCNIIYMAIVVNSNSGDDPSGLNRIQIFIPSTQYDLAGEYLDYMNSSDKANHPDAYKYPWAKSLVKDLKEGNIVYGSNIQNMNDEYIILGLDAYNPKNQPVESSVYDINGTGLLDLTMPIIMHNEVGLSISGWPDGITDSQYSNINRNDNGSWSIGLIQWHSSRAINLLIFLKGKNSNWKSCFSDTSTKLVKDIEAGTPTYQSYNSYKIDNQSDYDGVKRMLIEGDAKAGQREYASRDTQTAITDLQTNYGINNPAVIIFLADIMNQYGNGITKVKQGAGDICKNGKDTMSQLDEVVSYCSSNLGSYSKYKNRRDTTYSYIKGLNDQGKFSDGGLTNVDGSGNVVAGNGQYSYPFTGSARISACWGKGGYPSGGYHTGIDFAMAAGRPLYACTSGTINSTAPSYGLGLCITADDGNKIYYGHCSQQIKTSGRVNKGDLIGYSGYTGNCIPSGPSGAHLHFEVRLKPYKYGENGGGSDVNPFPFIGMSGNHENYNKQVSF